MVVNNSFEGQIARSFRQRNPNNGKLSYEVAGAHEERCLHVLVGHGIFRGSMPPPCSSSPARQRFTELRLWHGSLTQVLAEAWAACSQDHLRLSTQTILIYRFER